jgi:hypothetical protein
MLLHHDHALTILAVSITTPKSLLPVEVTLGLSAVCAIAVAATFIVALRRKA